FNHWDGTGHPMRSLGSSGIWELFVPGLGDGAPRRPRRSARPAAVPSGPVPQGRSPG
ncbi:hypothetical protein AB0D08_33730, partial [Kitasatospora sp. NPDC048540]|uniref:hypothetical protein n=1 Tax=Kitasatospora sp. NPDC048540 TaxID=3155634 RepID=UPI0033DE4A6C